MHRDLLFLFSLFVSTSLAAYCTTTVGPTSSVDTTLYQVTLQGDDDTKISDPNPACNGGSGYIGVVDRTNLLAELTAGQTYSISYNVSTCGGRYSVVSAAWIDYNTDDSFTGEQIISLSTVYGDQTWSFTVPETALEGNTRLRVQVQEGNATTLDPCASFPYGGTIDYSVNIRPSGPRYCPSGPTTATDMNLGPVQFTGFTQDIKDESDCPTVVGGADLTALIGDVNPGDSYTLNYQVTDCNAGSVAWPTLSGAWIDYDQDGAFEDWESVGVSQQTGLADVALRFTVPISTPDQLVIAGNTRMRVQVQETNAEVLDPCALFAWGGTKDFTIRVHENLNYCSSGPTSTSNTVLGDVVLLGSPDSINDPSTCATAQTGVVDHTTMVADVTSEVPATISWTVITCGTQAQTMSAAWLDYNHNEQFEGWEQITPRSNAFGLVSYGFKVPPSSPNQVVVGGPTRLRVQVQETSSTSQLNPCADFVSGGTRDYTVNIAPAPSDVKVESEARFGGRNRYSRVGF